MSNTAAVGSLLAFLGTILVAAITTWQARRSSVTAPYDALAARVTAQEVRIGELNTAVEEANRRAAAAERRALEAESNTAYAVAQESELLTHHLDVMQLVAEGKVPPFRAHIRIPPELRHRLSLEDYPPDPAPPPPDDGQDFDPTVGP